MTKARSKQTEVDFDLISSVAQGDSQALEEIYIQYNTHIFNYLVRLIHEVSIAEEILQEVFLAVWNGAAKFRGGSSVKTWIFRIAHNQAVSWVRQYKSKGEHLLVEEKMLEGLTIDHSTPEDDFFSQWRSGQIITALDHLSENHRAVIELAYVHDFTYMEIADVLNCPTGTVKSRMSYALKQLRNSLVRLDSIP